MQKVKTVFHKPVIWIAIVVTVLVLCLCCGSVVSAHGSQESTAATADETLPDHSLTERLSERIVCAGISCSNWLYELMAAEYPDLDVNRYDSAAVFSEAQQRRVIEYYTDDLLVKPLTRRFVCATLVRTFGYEARTIGKIADITDGEGYMQTAAYYGYFFPDAGNRLYPDAQITAAEFSALKHELDCRRTLKGKSALSFGDSIMHGSGNNDDGMGEMIAAKYGMTCVDYSYPGATMGVYKKHSHIPDQLRTASKKELRPDVIFLNGGTNDMVFTKIGSMTDGFDMEKVGEQEYSGGFEKTMWLLRNTWNEVPVIYVRSHNMNLGVDEKERKYGERGLEIAKKWGAVTIDLYNDSAMNTENPLISNLYTCLDDRKKNTHDSIHPTGAGYARFYLPPLSDALMKIFG